MNRAEFYKLVDETQEQEKKLLLLKGAAYSGTSDPFLNFKIEAEDLGLTKYQIWSVYAFKHISTIKRAIKVNPSAPVDHSEGLVGRIRDARNYLNLLLGMLTAEGLVNDVSKEDNEPAGRERSDRSTARRISRKAP